MSELHVFDKMTCPKCGYEHIMATKLTNISPNMQSGDFGICGKCKCFLRVIIINKQAKFRIPLEIELIMIALKQPASFMRLLRLATPKTPENDTNT